MSVSGLSKKHPQKLPYYEQSMQHKPIYKGTVQNNVRFGEPSQTSFFQLLLSFCLFLSHTKGKSFCQLWLFTVSLVAKNICLFVPTSSHLA